MSASRKERLRVSADIHGYDLDHDGIENFYWPVTHKDMTLFGEKFMFAVTRYFSDCHENEDALAVYKFTLKYFIAEAGGIFQGDLIRERADRDGVDIDVPVSWTKWPYLMRRVSPPLPAFIDKARRLPERNPVRRFFSRLPRLLQLLRRASLGAKGLKIDGIEYVVPSAENIASAIVATGATELIVRHAAQEERDVVFCRSSRWFSPVEDADILAASAFRLPVIERKFLEITESLYAEWGIPFLPHARQYLESYLEKLSCILRVHYQRLLGRGDLPSHLWTGTAGNIWDAMLRKAVMKNGGIAVGHDHGGGTCHVNIPMVGFIELWACSHFFTFNRVQAAEIGAAARGWPLLDGRVPEIVHPHDAPQDLAERPVSSHEMQGDIKKIFLLSTLYDGDRGRSFAFYTDMSYVDWQARLIGKLKAWGYEVYFKPHPESQIAYPDDFVSKLGAVIVEGRFEDVCGQADLFLFDYTYTSVLKPALETATPIVIVDFDNLAWYPRARELASLRCEIVTGGFDDMNRVQVDWDQLKSALKTAPAKSHSRELAENYFI